MTKLSQWIGLELFQIELESNDAPVLKGSCVKKDKDYEKEKCLIKYSKCFDRLCKDLRICMFISEKLMFGLSSLSH